LEKKPDLSKEIETMGVLADWQIERENIITPFEQGRKRPGVISYGCTSYGYDVRIGNKFQVFSPIQVSVIDPKNFDPKAVVEVTVEDHEALIIPPHSYVLGVSVERFKIPRSTVALCVGKSTLARCGIIVNVTPLEPEWEGFVTIEVSNTTPIPVKIYAGEGVMQCLFFRSDGIREKTLAYTKTQHHPQTISDVVELTGSCTTSYADKGGIYQGQKNEVVQPKVETNG
jgi:dCTP deaminase